MLWGRDVRKHALCLAPMRATLPTLGAHSLLIPPGVDFRCLLRAMAGNGGSHAHWLAKTASVVGLLSMAYFSRPLHNVCQAGICMRPPDTLGCSDLFGAYAQTQPLITNKTGAKIPFTCPGEAALASNHSRSNHHALLLPLGRSLRPGRVCSSRARRWLRASCTLTALILLTAPPMRGSSWYKPLAITYAPAFQ
jgi:hypothetical protein